MDPMYHLFSQISQPYTAIVLLLLVALARYWYSRGESRRSVVAFSFLLLLLYAISTPLIGRLAIYSLESRYPFAKIEPEPTDVVIVLSGSLVVEDDEGARYRLGPDSLTRCAYGLQLYREAAGCRVIVCGGTTESRPGPTLAQAMQEFLIASGVAADDITVEPKSATTYENALFLKEMLPAEGPGRVFLVTSAAHMYRAESCFRAQGMNVIPAPCGYRASRQEVSMKSLLPSYAGIAATNDAFHEWLGIVWYWGCGRL